MLGFLWTHIDAHDLNEENLMMYQPERVHQMLALRASCEKTAGVIERLEQFGMCFPDYPDADALAELLPVTELFETAVATMRFMRGANPDAHWGRTSTFADDSDDLSMLFEEANALAEMPSRMSVTCFFCSLRQAMDKLASDDRSAKTLTTLGVAKRICERLSRAIADEENRRNPHLNEAPTQPHISIGDPHFAFNFGPAR